MTEPQGLYAASRMIATCIEAKQQLKNDCFFRACVLLDMLIVELEKSINKQENAELSRKSRLDKTVT